MHPSLSPSILSLVKAAAVMPEDFRMSLLVWDNSPGEQSNVSLPKGARYHAAPHNPGLAAAYNAALALAEAEGYEWLLTLDQDTTLPEDFLTRMGDTAADYDSADEVAALLPHVMSDDRIISPFRFLLGIVPRCSPAGASGLMRSRTYAVNSSAVLRVSSLLRVRGYNPLFPLDFSDMDIFHRLHASGGRVVLVPNLVVEHHYSMLELHTRTSLKRYRDQLTDECAFWDLYMSPLARVERIARLIARSCRNRSIPAASPYAEISLQEVRFRLTTHRRKRMRIWNSMAASRANTAAEPADLTLHYTAR